jgi:hypothetical protein
MRVALLLTGMLREYKTAFESIKTNIMDPYGIKNEDIFISTWDQIGYWQAGDIKSQDSSHGIEMTGKVELNELQELYKTEHILLENFIEKEPWLDQLSDQYEEFFIPAINHSNCLVRKKNTLSMFYKIHSGGELIKNSGKEYDVIVRVRPDLCLFNDKLPVFGNFNNYYSLYHRNHIGHINGYSGGIGDNLHISSAENILKFTEAFTYMYDLFLSCDKIFCPHIFSQKILQRNNINNIEFNLNGVVYMHTSAGQYKIKDTDGIYKSLHDVNYEKFEGRFSGDCGKGK